MARYIDADAFLRRAESMYCLGCEKRMGIKNGKKTFIYGIGGAPCRACEVDDVKAELEDSPTADVVEVVRCKECKFYLHSDEKCELIDTRLRFYETDKRWTDECFCVWGERREDEQRQADI